MFPRWKAGADATRHIVQAKLWPANLRLLDPAEARQSAGLDGTQALLIVGFESADVPQDGNIRAAVALARELGGLIEDDQIRIDDGSGKATGREGAVGAWRSAFIGVNAGLMNGLGLSATPSRRRSPGIAGQDFDRHVRDEVRGALARARCGTSLSCRFTHVYPDGPAPYYTFSGAGKLGGEIEQWQEIKAAATAAVVAAGGTVTHHHAVGSSCTGRATTGSVPDLCCSTPLKCREASPWIPTGILNPGVLLD